MSRALEVERGWSGLAVRHLAVHRLRGRFFDLLRSATRDRNVIRDFKARVASEHHAHGREEDQVGSHTETRVHSRTFAPSRGKGVEQDGEDQAPWGRGQTGYTSARSNAMLEGMARLGPYKTPPGHVCGGPRASPHSE
jgi:hypothetical protein